MSTEQTCQTCRFWDKCLCDDSSGDCRRYPPKVIEPLPVVAEPSGPRTSCWVTDRPPTDKDANDCVLVTYRNGRTGWHPIDDVDDLMALQSDGGVVAWQRIPDAYAPTD